MKSDRERETLQKDRKWGDSEMGKGWYGLRDLRNRRRKVRKENEGRGFRNMQIDSRRNWHLCIKNIKLIAEIV